MRDIQKEYGRFGIQWGYASSPLLHEDSLYVQVLHGMHTDDPSYLLRIDKATGKTLWRVERPTNARMESPDAYTTPALLRYKGTTEIVITGGDVVTGHDLATGKELWRADGLNPTNNGSFRIVASPLIVGETIVAPSRERPLLVLRAGGRGDVTKSHLAWQFNQGPDVPSPVSDGTYLYSINDRGIMYCLDLKTGNTVYGPQRLRPATYSGSPVLADGKIYITDEDGVTTVVQAGPKFALLAENDFARVHAQLAGRFGGPDLHPHGFRALCDWGEEEEVDGTTQESLASHVAADARRRRADPVRAPRRAGARG